MEEVKTPEEYTELRHKLEAEHYKELEEAELEKRRKYYMEEYQLEEVKE